MRYIFKKILFLFVLIFPLKLLIALDGEYVHDKERDGDMNELELVDYNNQREATKKERKNKEKTDLEKMNEMKLEIKDKKATSSNNQNTFRD